MKNSILFLACAALMFVGCAKVEREEVVPEKGKRLITLRATVDEPGTRLSVNGSGKFSWQQGDYITVFKESNGSYSGTDQSHALNDGPTGDFEIYLNEDETISYAMYPASEYSEFDATNNTLLFGLDERYDYVLGSTYMPMLGSDITVEDEYYYIKASFKAVGGVLKLTINNFPTDEDVDIQYLRFSVSGKRITGSFPIQEDADGKKYIETEDYVSGSDNGTNYIDIEYQGGYYTRTMTYYFPLPCGTYNDLSFTLYDGCDEPIFSRTARIDGGLTVHRNEVITAPALNL